MAKLIKAVIFDQDGLMFDSERLVAEGWAFAGKKFDYDVNEDFLRGVRGRSVAEIKAAFLASQYLDANATVAHESRSKATYGGRYINTQHIMPVASDTLTQPTASMPNLYPQNPSQSALKTAKPRLNTDKYAIAAPIRPRNT